MTTQHTPRYSSMNAQCHCSCGWTTQAANKRDGLNRIAAHMGAETNDAFTARKSQEARNA